VTRAPIAGDRGGMDDPAGVRSVPVRPASVVDDHLPPGLDVAALIDSAAAVDGFAAVNETGRLALARSVPGRVHLVRSTSDSGAVAYAALDLGTPDLSTDPVPDHVAPAGTRPVVGELVVDPASRRRGIGRQLLGELLELAAARAPGAAFSIWAHRDTAAARALALASGLTVHRTLLLLRRLPGPLPDVPLPPGVRLAAFRPGVDEQAWLDVNAAAFASHPEQGRWTTADLADREAADWFDPAGLLLAWSEGLEPRLLGSHWTKIPTSASATASAAPAPAAAPVGEVYVLGVSPDAHTPGLGTALAVAGIASLAARGVGEVELYVESDNARALGIYRRLGFTEHSRDVAWGTRLRSSQLPAAPPPGRGTGRDDTPP